METKVYIGDGVYAQRDERDGYAIWLTTERANGTHRICLEPSMLHSLNKFAESLGWR